jgi:hypothetical protein
MDGLLLACSCGLDPASESMLVQTGLAAALSVPFWFRSQIFDVVRRLRGLPPSTPDECLDPEPDDPRGS